MFAAVNNRRAFWLDLVIPPRGPWTADVRLDTDDAISWTDATLVLAGLSLGGFVMRIGVYSGITWLRLGGGRGGWHREIPERFYQNPFGLQLKPIVSDAASAVGESVTVQTDSAIGTFYARERGPASRVLNQLAPNWYVKPDGTTYVGERPTGRVTSTFAVLEEQNLASGVVAIATEYPEDWMPGVTFSASSLSERQASTVVHRLESEKLRTEVWTSDA